MADLNNSTQNVPENNSNPPKSTQDDDFVKTETIKQMLHEAGIQNYDSLVITHLSDYINNYATEVIDQASTFTKHAGRDAINLVDVKLALDVITKKSSKRLSYKELIKMAHEHNKSQLPECSGGGYLPLPTDGGVLAQCNYKLRPTNPQIPMNLPFMDLTHRQNTFMSLNAMKNHPGGMPTVIRTSTGQIPHNVPQRIIMKPQIPYTTHNKMEEHIRKRMKYEDYRK